MTQHGEREENGADAREPLCCVIAVGGLVASGKTTLARALAQRLGAAHVEADHERAALLAPAASVHEAEAMRSFAADVEARVYAALMQRAEPIVARGGTVALDGCFARADQRRAAHALARRNGAPFLFVECAASAEATRARLAERDARAARIGWSWLHAEVAACWKALDALAADEHCSVETSAEPRRALGRVEARTSIWRRAAGGPASRPRPT